MKQDDFVENLEQTQESAEAPHRPAEQDLARVQELASELMAQLERMPDGDLVAEVVENGIKLLRDQTNRGDMKLINKAMKEIRYALRIFAPYRDVHKVSIFGSARTPEDSPDYKQAEEFGRQIAARGWMVITGAGGGIMAAGHGGAGPDPSFGLAIRLPFEQKTNVHISKDKKLINFNYFFTRKLMFVRSSHAVVLFPGGFGTMDEGFEVLTLVQTGKAVPMPIVFVDQPGGSYWRDFMNYAERHLLGRGFISPPDLLLFKVTDSVEVAVEEVTRFYSNYHSVRTVREELVMRLQKKPTEKQLAEINEKFRDITVAGGEYRVSEPLPVEADEPSLADLARLVFKFNRRDHGRLRALIDHLNTL